MRNSIMNLVLLLLTFPLVAIASSGVDLSQGCSQSQWIGIRTSKIDRCPKIVGWRVQNLFDQSDNLNNRRLNQFCTFERLRPKNKHLPNTADRVHNTQLPGVLDELIEQDLLENNVQQNCSVVDASASPKPDVMNRLEKHLLYQVDRLAVSVPRKRIHPVRLALLDTLPTADHEPWTQPTNSPHGLSLAIIAQKLLCDASERSCFAKLTSQLALAYSAERNEEQFHLVRDETRGGFFGSISDVAKAIHRETVAWQTSTPESKLVLNLSLGWNSLVWGGAEEDPRNFGADIQSVYFALVDASCRGALVLAAAGNQGNNKSIDQGPLLPAAWETLPAPSKDECYRLTGKASKSQSEKHPLLYAVAGIDSLGNPLSNSRPKGLSKLFAYGDHSIVQSSYGNNSEVLTGSSVATSVVSSTAAAVWSNRPELSAHDLMYLIYRSGNKLDFLADFSGTQYGGMQSKRVSMCSALTYACARGECETPAPCQWSKTGIDLSGTSVEVDPPQYTHSLNNLAKCSLVSDPGCEIKQLGSRTISPWVVPQPDSDPCPNCVFMESSDQLIMQYNTSFIGNVSDAQLVIDESVYSIPAFANGDKVIVENVLTGSPVNQMWLSVLINNSYRENIPLLNTQ